MAATTENRIKAVNVAREWIEVVENIRNTNWIKFSSDYDGCYDVLNYNALCIGSGSGTTTSIQPGSYVPILSSNGLWTLSGVTTLAAHTWASRPQYMSAFPVYLDANGLVTQTGAAPTTKCAGDTSRNCTSIFTREIRITRPADYSSIGIESIVTWSDNTRAEPYIISLSHTLKNWKYNYYQK